MRTWIAALALFLAGCCCQPSVERPTPPREAFVETLLRSTYQIKAHCEDGLHQGSGVALLSSKGEVYYATANHVIGEPGECSLEAGGRPLELVDTDPAFDIAILRGEAAGYVRSIEASDVYLGMFVTTVGYPYQVTRGRTGLQVTSGEVSSIWSDQYKISSPVYFGNSGGPVFDEEGNLVGLVVALAQRNEVPLPGEYFATPAWRVYEMLDEAIQ